MVAYLSKSDASAGFNQIVDFLNAQVIQYALMVNPTIYVLRIKEFQAMASIKKANDAKVSDVVLIEAHQYIFNESPLVGVNTPRCDEDSLELMELMVFMAFITAVSYKLLLFGLMKDADVHLMLLVDFLNAQVIQYALMVNPTIYVLRIKEFQATASIKKANDVVQLQALIDRKKGRKDDDNAATKDVSAAEPTVFDDEENAVAEQIQEKHLGNIIKYRSLKRKPISIAHARKNMIIYLKNMAGYKMEHFECMTYDKKKRVAEETLLQERFKKLKAVEVSVSELKVEALQVKYLLIDWEIHSKGSRSYWKIIRVGGITEAYQSFEYMLKGFDKEDLDALWRLVKEKFSSAMPT
nr:hypothetical protein [Tanacetum cinerariifolium]